MSESGIFKAAVKLPPDRRAAYLDWACGSDAELRAEVESLLHAHDATGGFLEDVPAGPDPTEDYRPIAEGPGTVIGPYKLMEQIGEGGFGLVFVAEQQHPIRRMVALKIIKPGMDSRDVIARFEAERQALALMDHPNIAKVLDAGAAPDGRPDGVWPASKTLAMFGWSIKASACRSASKRASTCLESMPSLTTLSATRRWIGSVWSAIQTVPMPPSPMSSSSL